MTPKTLSILAVRLMVVFLLLEGVSPIGYTIYNMVLWKREGIEDSFYGLIPSLCYLIILLLLLKLSNSIGDRVSKGIEPKDIQTTWTRTELLSVAIAAISVLIVLSAIPNLVNQVHGTLEYYERFQPILPEKERLNRAFFAILGSIVQVGVGVYSYFRATYFARLWEKWQSSAA